VPLKFSKLYPYADRLHFSEKNVPFCDKTFAVRKNDQRINFLLSTNLLPSKKRITPVGQAGGNQLSARGEKKILTLDQ
jgi:hypothetical protein